MAEIRFLIGAGIVSSAMLGGCTSVAVKPVDIEAHRIVHVCISENTKPIVNDFVDVLQDGLERHAISSELIRGTAPEHCEYVMRYTALQSWDFDAYLSHAELWLDQRGKRIGHATYHLRGKGGFSLMKWQGTRAKMDPVIDELLGARS